MSKDSTRLNVKKMYLKRQLNLIKDVSCEKAKNLTKEFEEVDTKFNHVEEKLKMKRELRISEAVVHLEKTTGHRVPHAQAEKYMQVQMERSDNHYLKSLLTEAKVQRSLEFIKKEEIAKIIGTAAHFCYWAVFGGFNELPMDSYHMEALFKSLLQQVIKLKA